MNVITGFHVSDVGLVSYVMQVANLSDNSDEGIVVEFAFDIFDF